MLKKNKQIIYCFKKKYSFIYNKKGPKEFFYGLDYVKNYLPTISIAAGHYSKLSLLRIIEKVLAYLSIVGCHFQIYLNNKEKINSKSILFAVEDGTSFGILFFKLFGLINNKVIVLIQGLHDRYQYYNFFKYNKPLGYLYSKLLCKADYILTLSNYEKDLLIKSFKLPKKKVKVLYFGTDLDYWSKKRESNKSINQEFALTIGNDMHRDYDLLINHYNLKIPLRIVTKRLNKKQLQKIKDNKIFDHYQQVSNEDLRSLYGQAKFVIIPLRTTYATSGLSTILQALAMEKPVLVANAPALQELFKNYRHVLYYETNNSFSFQQKLNELNQNEELRNKLAKNGNQLVKTKFNSDNMGKNILKLFHSVINS